MSNSVNIMTTDLNSSPSNTKADLVNNLRQQYADITFTKKDGTLRVMKCTLKEGIAIPHERKTDRVRESKDNILPVWDIEADAWRSVNIETIESVRFYESGNPA